MNNYRSRCVDLRRLSLGSFYLLDSFAQLALNYQVKLNQVVGAPLPLPERFVQKETPAANSEPTHQTSANDAKIAAAAATRKRIVEPTDAEVDAYHADYVAALVALFEAHKATYGCADKTLKIV